MLKTADNGVLWVGEEQKFRDLDMNKENRLIIIGIGETA